MGSEAAGLEQASGDVVGQVAESEGGASQVFEAAVDGLGRAIAGSGVVEVGQDVCSAPVKSASEPDQFGQRGRHAGLEGVNEPGHDGFACVRVFVPVGGHHALVDAPGGGNLDVLVGSEKGF